MITSGYEDVGAGDAVVLVHGHPFNRSMWRPQLDRFGRAGFRVIAPDLRGYGEAAVLPGKTTLAEFAADIAGLLDRLGVDRAVLCGLSMGGQIVMDFYRQFPSRVRALVLADTFAGLDTPERRQLRLDTADRLERDGMAEYAAEELPKMVSPLTIATRPAVADHVLEMMRGTPPAGAAAALRGRAERPDYTPVLAAADVPALILVGRDDGYTPIPDAEAMHRLLTGSTLVVIDDAGHLPNLERPAAFDAALDTFLSSLSP
ncbi:MAG TPA: alpha/beta fold hydrolase [Actinophytocola sp.]|uniref:alpha/beta fold hydrolase n=1 Tax=Actinophytocola sp. TaxID=1872138 RepID=UPI002DBE47E8|nr:alpha/beta fold hydrolase [Actinophytocola sp.]HEU5474075.1 alpha/beta fold hydrolase [Actinophytocola sp.]